MTNRFSLQEGGSNEKVAALTNFLRQLPELSLPTEMVVHGSMCARTIFIPAGTVLTGCETKIDNICVVHGDITVTTDQGPKRITGFHVLTAKAGFKRAGLAHEDTWWTTIHHTELTDAESISKEMTDEHEQLQTSRLEAPALPGKERNLCLGQQ